jgi:hypothetical protein
MSFALLRILDACLLALPKESISLDPMLTESKEPISKLHVCGVQHITLHYSENDWNLNQLELCAFILMAVMVGKTYRCHFTV